MKTERVKRAKLHMLTYLGQSLELRDSFVYLPPGLSQTVDLENKQQMTLCTNAVILL